ncbi:polyunsaturated fatty acid lipoxygenase ALOX15B-like [Colossoma macropomum]|uniref:polyunsaturated fatty acid lipoxygenase ALOX15B-like n=1 Tax=Colossoma macropomum TaxID=42526 RepID=UPI001863D054|nr:polyunsaturated fatty acid lipoxygenase ALOX15B-like [Colossoma macropomum]
MVKYTVEVFTGDAFTAGNANAIFIKLIGTKGSSEPQILDRFTGIPGCSKTLTVSCKESLGTFFLVQLELKALVFEDYWFCSKVIVTEPEGRRLLFPCYQWLSPKKKAILREATAKLSHKDTEEPFAIDVKMLQENFTGYKAEQLSSSYKHMEQHGGT